MSDKTESDQKQEESHPSWIDIPLVTEALRSSGEENLVVTAISVGSATKAGDNYGSSMLRVTATLSTGDSRTLIIKIPIGLEATGQDYDAVVKIFNREAGMLATYLPQMQELLKEVDPQNWSPFGPNCLKYQHPPNAYVIMEDLCLQGFRIANRQKGLGLRHSLLAFRTLARLHAASHVLLKRNPDLEKEFDNVWRLCGAGFEIFLKSAAQTLADKCRTWHGFEDYAQLLENIKDTVGKTFYEINDPKPGRFNVITHGDSWVNNMMFRYDEDGKPCDLRLVDFQMAHLASPVTDLLYFLGASVSEDVSTHHQDLLFREYHVALKEALALFGMQAPTLEEILEDVQAHGAYMMLNSFNGVPIMKSNHVLDLEASFQGDNSGYEGLFDDPFVKKWFQRTLPEFRRRGWLPE